MAKLMRSRLEGLAALRKLGEHLGMWGKITHKPAGYRPPAPEVVLAAAFLVFHLSTPADARQACAMLLDYWLPDWRDVVGEANLGIVVDRNDPAVARWRSKVIARDGRACARCGATRGLHAHHIVPWADAPELRLDPDNGMTLCGPCHAEEHPELSGLMFAQGTAQWRS